MAQPSGNISLKEFFSLNWGKTERNSRHFHSGGERREAQSRKIKVKGKSHKA
jgi:hypothetical protein